MYDNMLCRYDNMLYWFEQLVVINMLCRYDNML